jgi:hypothetical protein
VVVMVVMVMVTVAVCPGHHTRDPRRSRELRQQSHDQKARR